jgi:hypothetical protein
MSLRNKLAAAALAVAWAGWACAQTTDPKNLFRVNLPAGSPVTLVSADWGQSNAVARGGALQVDLRSTLIFRNSSPAVIRGISLLVLAQEVTPGGKGSVTVPSLDVQPGETVPIHVDLRLMRPLATQSGALVEVALDGVLFGDLTFYGPNRLNARRAMLAWEMEARRDRKALLAALESGGEEALRGRLLAAMARQDAQPQLAMQVGRTLPATNLQPERTVSLAFLHVPAAPVELVAGDARLAGVEARAPRIEIQNRSRKPIRYIELGWLIQDAQGRETAAGVLPADLALAPGARSTVRKDNTLKFARPANAITVYPAMVEYSDGELWVPPSEALRDPRLPASGETLRLAGLYRRKGLGAVVQTLRAMR